MGLFQGKTTLRYRNCKNIFSLFTDKLHWQVTNEISKKLAYIFGQPQIVSVCFHLEAAEFSNNNNG